MDNTGGRRGRRGTLWRGVHKGSVKMQRVALSAMLACGLALALWSLPALASNGQGKALSEDKVADVCKLSALLKRMSREAKKLGSVATLATGFEPSAAEEDMHVMREALGSAARLLRRRARRGADTRNETQAREMAERVVRLHEAEQTKALAAQLAENVRQRTLLTAAPIDIRIKTFAANFQGSNVARIVAQSGTGNGKAKAERFATTDTQAGGCAATADKVATAIVPQQKMPTQDNEWQQAISAAEASKRDMLVGSESTTKCTLTASTENSYAGAAADATQPWGFFWQLTGHSTSSSVELKWSDAHQDLGTEKPKSEDALNEMWLHFKQLKETHRQMHNACNGQAKGAPAEQPEAQHLFRYGDENRNMRLAIAKKVMAEDASDEAHRAQRAARIEQEARTQENANTQKDAAQGGTQTQQNKQGGHRGPAPQTRTAASESAAHARSCRQQARGAAATRVAFLAGSKNRKHAHE
ncbi:hypothetical protein, conserved in T. vivax [Trypanosoma vivax Y486]|uniref:Uncharacterized protein n=1 Tax=Trypanosoma vivax (strain Y486) TaxID=1055687 RepID=F9WMM2_TRYVY|nr:hypothetical protein, conserved in T. vivax [Trypanosoma vivax Y486]|eukprot:CCD18779.1 hypothetical protein, conserved in T. vivax [Trypanosoma vivax Y486]